MKTFLFPAQHRALPPALFQRVAVSRWSPGTCAPGASGGSAQVADARHAVDPYTGVPERAAAAQAAREVVDDVLGHAVQVEAARTPVAHPTCLRLHGSRLQIGSWKVSQVWLLRMLRRACFRDIIIERKAQSAERKERSAWRRARRRSAEGKPQSAERAGGERRGRGPGARDGTWTTTRAAGSRFPPSFVLLARAPAFPPLRSRAPAAGASRLARLAARVAARPSPFSWRTTTSRSE